MLKLRLHGTTDELQRYLSVLRNDPKIEILSESNLYSDRGKSAYKRCYLDIEMNEIIEAIYDETEVEKYNIEEKLIDENT